MKLDANGLVVMEQSTFPGSIGDSASETGRMVTLQALTGQLVMSQLSLFVTPQGVIRYPTSPWGPSDTSADQVAPLLAACTLKFPVLANTINTLIAVNEYRTGNGTLINPGLWAQMMRSEGSHLQWVWDMAILGQALIFLLPLAWNPSATLDPVSWFVSPATQSSGYLNWVNALAFARQRKWTWPCWLATKLISSNKVMSMVHNYYLPEPNSSWILQLYAKALPKIWT